MTRKYSEQEIMNLRLIKNVYDKVLIPLDSMQVDNFIAPEYIQHNPLAVTGANGLKTFLDWAKGISDRPVHDIKHIYVDDNMVIAHVHVIPNYGERGNNVIDIFRIENDLVIEHWDAAQPISENPKNDNGVF